MKNEVTVKTLKTFFKNHWK